MTTHAASASTTASGRPVGAPPNSPFDLWEWKLHAPAARSGIVARTALVSRLMSEHTPPVISVIAPPGYGKTTLLAQWAAHKRPRSGWLSIDERDNDPTVLLTYIAASLDGIEPISLADFEAIASPGAGMAAPQRLVAVIASMTKPVSLVFDNFEVVTNRDCIDLIAALALGFPAGSHLAIGSRDVVALPIAHLRAQGRIAEIGVDDLAMSGAEARSLLVRVGVSLTEPHTDDLVRRTEGWPVGLYLAALAVSAGGSPTEAAAAFSGDDRFIGDYLRSELLDRLSPDEVSFLTRTSILERMSGPLCDATLDVAGSDVLLARLESRNLLVMPLDQRRDWYRYHHLFRELLESELRRREPGMIATLHLRAAEWCEANGLPEAAIDHAQAAGDADRVASLVLRIANPVWSSGRADTVLRWMEWFEANGLVERFPAIAVHGALMFALAGQPGAAERWAADSERTTPHGTLADGNTMEATVAYLRALLCRNGVEAMRRDAQIAAQGLSPASPYRATMRHVEGVSYLLTDDLDCADLVLARAVDEATDAGVLPLVPVLLAERGIVAIERNDWTRAESFVEEALAIMRRGRFDEYWTSALVYSWAARVAIQRGAVAEGREHVARAARLRPLLNYALPVVSVQALLEMTRAYIALADQGGARAVLRQANDIFQQRPALGNLQAKADELRAEVDTIRVAALGASSLTTAELRLLPLLPTHLTFREIGERLYVSRHTIKTQAISVYRKLGVSSRSETIARMYELGLVEHD